MMPTHTQKHPKDGHQWIMFDFNLVQIAIKKTDEDKEDTAVIATRIKSLLTEQKIIDDPKAICEYLSAGSSALNLNPSHKDKFYPVYRGYTPEGSVIEMAIFRDYS